MANADVENCRPATAYSSISLHEPVKIRVREDEGQPITVPQLFKSKVQMFGDHPALVYQDDDKNWITYTYQDYWTKSRQIARAFIKLGLKPRTSCGILAFSRPEWFFTQMATIFVGGVSAGIYLTNSAEAVYHVLETSNATICVVDDSIQMAKVRSIRDRLPNLKSIIQMQGPYEEFIDTEEGYYSWPQVEVIGAREIELELDLEERLKLVSANECVTLIYTSGTVGMPKAVMLSHDNIISNASAMINCMPNIIYGQEVLVSYLPLSHIGGQLFDFFTGMLLGGCVYFADRNALKGTLIRTLMKAQPTRFFGVPRIFEKMQEKIATAERKMSWISRWIFQIARITLRSYHLTILEGGSKPMNSLGHWIGSRVTQDARTALGFSQCKTILTGAAPSTTELKRFFLSYDIKVTEIYGLSESAGPMTGSWTMLNLTTCGKAIPGVELKLVNTDQNGHGEICTRSRMVFMGYLHDPKKTKEALSKDGWLNSGDIGYLDSEGCLYITGRLKELIITSGGENIPPVHIELMVKHELPALSNVMVIGDRRKFLTMLVTIKTVTDENTGRPTDFLQTESLEWIKSIGLPYVILTEILNPGPCPKVLQSIQKGIDRVNANAISNAQRVQKFVILPHDFSIPTGELGPTLKLRRNVVTDKYADVIENMYKYP